MSLWGNCDCEDKLLQRLMAHQKTVFFNPMFTARLENNALSQPSPITGVQLF